MNHSFNLAVASNSLPDSAKAVMIAVAVAGAIVLAAFAFIVYRTSKRKGR